jgi:tetratricopeptide (TPR) repeat protein
MSPKRRSSSAEPNSDRSRSSSTPLASEAAALGWRSCLVIAALALATRLVYLHVAEGAGIFDGTFLDSKYYAEQAQWIRLGQGAGGRPYLLAPLYPYFLALFTDSLGHLDASAVRVAQALFGSASAVLAAWIAASLSDRRAGWIAGGVAALYGPLVHTEAMLLAAGLQAFCLTLGIAILVWHDRRERTRVEAAHEGRKPIAWAFAGLAFGIAAGLHATALAIAAATVAGLWISAATARRVPREWKPDLDRSGALLAGLLLAVAPFTIRNLRASGELTLLSANGGMNFWIGNHEHATGLFRTPPDYDFAHDPVGHAIAERDLGRKLTYGEASAWWTGRAIEDIRADPLRWLGLVGKKLLLFAHPLEIPQLGESFAWARDRAWPLRFPVEGRMVLLLALAAPIFFGLRHGARAIVRLRWPMIALASQALVLALFFVTGRYRAPIMPVAIALAAAGVVALLDLLRRRPWSGGVYASLAMLLGLAVASHFVYDSPGAPLFIAPADAVEERHRGMSLYAQGRFAEAIDVYRHALEETDDPITRTNLANALKALGRIDEAAAEYRRVLEENPRDGLAWYNYGNLLRTHVHDYRGAEEAYRRAIDYLPRLPEAHFNLGIVLLELDEPEDAAAAIESGLSLAPESASWRADAENALLVARTRATARAAGPHGADRRKP